MKKGERGRRIGLRENLPGLHGEDAVGEVGDYCSWDRATSRTAVGLPRRIRAVLGEVGPHRLTRPEPRSQHPLQEANCA